MISTKIKSIIRKYLLKFMCLLPKFNFCKEIEYSVLGSSSAHYFVGYYDIDPFSHNTSSILCHNVSFKYTNCVTPSYADIGLLNINSNTFHAITNTRALNWQLGSRVQFLSNNEIIYNDIIDNRQCSIIYNIDNSKTTNTLLYPFWGISPDKKYGVSLNFARLNTKRAGYGYKGDHPDGQDECLTVFEICSQKIILKKSLHSILEAVNYVCPSGTDPYLNHVAWSPCSTKFLTLFHYHCSIDGSRRIYPVLVDITNGSFNLISDSGIFSHHTWVNSDRLLAFLKLSNLLTYGVWDEINGWQPIDVSLPATDGHPSYIAKSDSIIVDSYPDRLGRMSIYHGNIRNHCSPTKIGMIRNYPRYTNELRCDLHPRVTSCHNYIVCDVPTKSGRKILIINNNFL